MEADASGGTVARPGCSLPWADRTPAFPAFVARAAAGPAPLAAAGSGCYAVGVGRRLPVLMVAGLVVVAVPVVGCVDIVHREGEPQAGEGEGEGTGPDAGRACTPGDTRPCRCADDREGTQGCLRDGSGWSECLCYVVEGEGEGPAEGEGEGEPEPACTFGQDQSCNDSPLVSALWGHCEEDGTCTCFEGLEVNPETGRCRPAGGEVEPECDLTECPCPDAVCRPAGRCFCPECSVDEDCPAGEACMGWVCEPVVTDCVPGPVNPEAPVSERWVQVCPGEFVMGSPAEEPDREPWDPGSETQHRVEITRPFLVKATEVTQGEWRAVARAEGWAVENPSTYPGDDLRPVETVNWWEALRYLNALSRGEDLDECYVDFTGCDGDDPGSGQECASVTWPGGLDCEGFRLPTEAEWEYAARAGTTGMFYNCGPQGEADACDAGNLAGCGALNADLAEVAVYCANDPGHPAEVGSRAPNAWGLHDALGNVYEWAWDWYATGYGGHQGMGGVVTDPLGGPPGVYRVFRGGSWALYAEHCRTAFRFRHTPGARNGALGLRPARSVEP